MRGALPGVAGWGRGGGVCEPWLGCPGSLFEDESVCVSLVQGMCVVYIHRHSSVGVFGG